MFAIAGLHGHTFRNSTSACGSPSIQNFLELWVTRGRAQWNHDLRELGGSRGRGAGQGFTRAGSWLRHAQFKIFAGDDGVVRSGTPRRARLAG
jgi:hypothetical protein